jgi:hypothetical protein
VQDNHGDPQRSGGESCILNEGLSQSKLGEPAPTVYPSVADKAPIVPTLPLHRGEPKDEDCAQAKQSVRFQAEDPRRVMSARSSQESFRSSNFGSSPKSKFISEKSKSPLVVVVQSVDNSMALNDPTAKMDGESKSQGFEIKIDPPLTPKSPRLSARNVRTNQSKANVRFPASPRQEQLFDFFTSKFRSAREAFIAASQSGEGLDRLSFCSLLRKLSFCCDERDLELLFLELDSDRDGYIGTPAFTSLLFVYVSSFC